MIWQKEWYRGVLSGPVSFLLLHRRGKETGSFLFPIAAALGGGTQGKTDGRQAVPISFIFRKGFLP